MYELRECKYCGEVSDVKTSFCRKCGKSLPAEGTEVFLEQCIAYVADEKEVVINKKMAKVAMWLAIFSLLLMWSPILSMSVALIATILGCIVVKKKKDGKKIGQASVIMSFIAVFLMTIVYGSIGYTPYGGDVVNAICFFQYDKIEEALDRCCSAMDEEIAKHNSEEASILESMRGTKETTTVPDDLNTSYRIFGI